MAHSLSLEGQFPPSIQGNGIFTYMNGWFFRGKLVGKYIPIPWILWDSQKGKSIETAPMSQPTVWEIDWNDENPP